jgi:hypothetical protein
MTGNFFQLNAAFGGCEANAPTAESLKCSNLAVGVSICPLAPQLQSSLEEQEPDHAEKSFLD